MGYGYLESVYEKRMLIELAGIGLNVETQKRLKVFYQSQIVGDFVADVIVNDTVIIELKSVSKIVKAHEIQFGKLSRYYQHARWSYLELCQG